MKRLKKTKRPLILTVNGKAEAVVQDAEPIGISRHRGASRCREGIRQGLEDLKKAASVRRRSSELFRRIHEILV